LKMKRYILAGLSGVLMVIIFPGINISHAAWFALVPLLIAIHDANWKQALISGFITGIIYFGGTLNWFMSLHPYSSLFWVILGFALLMLYLSSYVFIFAVSVNFINRLWRPASSREYLASSFLAAVVWTGLEILRGYVVTGFPWMCLGHSQWANLPIIQISSLTGMYGVTFLVVIVNAAIANFLIDISRWRSSAKAAAVPVALVIICLVYGGIALSESPRGEKIKVALVPGNIKQMDKLRSWRTGPEWILRKYIRITDKAAAEKPDMIIWPETCIPDYMFSRNMVQEELKSAVQRWNSYLLMGTPHVERSPERRIYNASFLLSPAGEIVDSYYKIHLVPVSEYFPMKRYLPESWQELVSGVSDWDMGSKHTIFSAPPARFGVVICFESIFPGIFRKFVSKDVNLMGIITNDAWFEGTYAPEQHYSMAPFRAVENRVSVFRCANYGISCIIDAWGRVAKNIEPDKGEDYLVGELSLRKGGTFYTRHGDYLPWACLAMTLFLIFQTWRLDILFSRREKSVIQYTEK